MSSSETMSHTHRDDAIKYSKKEYWDDRYTTEESYEWFVGYDEIKQLLQKYIQKSDRVLMLGCGNSPLSVDMYQDGYRHITNIDYSATCIQNMSAKYKTSMPEMTWRVMDAQCLDFDNGSFNVVLEKGMFDALMVEETDPWIVSTETRQCFHQILTEVSRVLKDSGRFVSVTFAQPHFRIPLYAQPTYGWSLVKDDIITTGHIVDYFSYMMTKGDQLTTEQKECAEKFFTPQATGEDQVIPFEDTQTEEDFLKAFL